MTAPSTRHIEVLLAVTHAPTIDTSPVVSGVRVVGQTLTTTDGTWTNSPTSFPLYDWQRDDVSIGAANASTYVLQAADVGHTIRCAVTAANSSGSSAPANSNGLSIVPEIVGTDVQFWTAAGFGLGGAPGIQIPNPTAVWDNVTHAETVAGDVEYRGTFIKNIHEVRSVPVLLWIDGQTTSPTTDLAIGIAVEAAGQDLAAIPNESTPPVGVTFSAPASEAGALVMGLLGPGQARGYWQRRTVTAGTADLPTDTCTVAYSAIPE